MKPAVQQYLGLMRRSGNLTTGQELVLNLIRSKKARLVLLAEDIGESSRKRIIDKCHFYEIPVVVAGLKAEISAAIGQSRSVVATTNKGFAEGFLKRLNE